jgi:hypothetical protein
MSYYQPNPACHCGRCSTRGLMGPAVLVTLGLLFLAGNMSEYGFDRTWPILLVVIGAIKIVRYVAAGDHINPVQYAPPYQPYGVAASPAPGAAPGAPIVTPPPAPNAGILGEGRSDEVSRG